MPRTARLFATADARSPALGGRGFLGRPGRPEPLGRRGPLVDT